MGHEHDHAPSDTATFTGEVLPVFYVKDVVKSVAFYRDLLGFDHHDYYDYEAGKDVKEWTKDTPAIYAEMSSGEQLFALHLPNNTDSLVVGGMIHYFGVKDVLQHYQLLKDRGVRVGKIYERPWMTMFSVVDPDGHRIFFFTRPEQ